MATTKCPSCGADSVTADYCDTCGAALAAPDSVAAAPSAPASSAPPTDAPDGPSAPAVGACANCGAVRTADDTFCEGCGLDFATGQVPAAPAPTPVSGTGSGAPSGWIAVVEADRAFFDSNEADSPTPLAFPANPSRREVPLTGEEVLIGRRSEDKGFFPAIDLSSPVADPGVSHRHAALRRQPDGSWALVDDMSTNGTWINGGDEPVDHGVVTALHDGDHLNLGSFTRITIVHSDKAP